MGICEMLLERFLATPFMSSYFEVSKSLFL